MPWSGATVFGTGLGPVDAVSMIESNFGSPGHLEVMARAGRLLAAFYRELSMPLAWRRIGNLPIDASGVPAMIPSQLGSKGNFELVTPVPTGRMAHICATMTTHGTCGAWERMLARAWAASMRFR